MEHVFVTFSNEDLAELGKIVDKMKEGVSKVNNSLEATVNALSDAEIINELAAVHNQMKVVKEMEDEDEGVILAKETLAEEKAPYTERLTYLKKYAKAIFAVCKARGLRLKIKENK